MSGVDTEKYSLKKEIELEKAINKGLGVFISPLEKELKDKYGNIIDTLRLYEKPSTKKLEIDYIDISYDYRELNNGTLIMQDIIKYADENNITIHLNAQPEWASDKDRLVSWYKSFGFIENKNNVDNDRMIRKSKKV